MVKRVSCGKDTDKSRILKHSRKLTFLLVSSQTGSTIVELTYVLPIMLFVVLGGIGLLWMGYNTVASQFVINKAIRQAVVRTCIAEPNVDEVVLIEDMIIDSSKAIGIKLDRSNITVCNDSDPIRCEIDESAGDKGDFLYINISYPVTVLYPFSAINISATAIGRNERVLIRETNKC